MKALCDHVSTWLAIFFWLVGIALAKGFWLTACAFIFPPFAWYLVVERLVNS